MTSESTPAVEAAKAKEETETAPPLPPLPPRGDPTTAMLWYYCDKEGLRQGPFYPGQMRQWWKGEIPRGYAPVTYYFDGDLEKTAFVAASGVALWPTANAAQTNEPEEEEEVVRQPSTAKPKWLEDSLDRQRRGIVRRYVYGPVERENYN